MLIADNVDHSTTRPLDGELAISITSLAELHSGVLVTGDAAARAERLVGVERGAPVWTRRRREGQVCRWTSKVTLPRSSPAAGVTVGATPTTHQVNR